MTTELEQLADQLAPDYDAKRAMQDLQMTSQMVAVGREELALVCVNRVNAYLWKLDQLATAAPVFECCEHCVNWDTPRHHQHPTPCSYITDLGSAQRTGDPPTTCQSA